jgi:hypothetical protein
MEAPNHITTEAARTWGPFTGRQLTTMFVALCCVLMPGAVWAADAYTNVAITDPVSGRTANVDANRRLEISDGSGALTVDGTLTALEASRLNYRRAWKVASHNTCLEVIRPPAGRALIIKTAHFNTYSNPTPGPTAWTALYVTNPANGCVGLAATENPAGIGVTQLDFTPGLVVPAGQALLARVNNVQAEIAAFGYDLPATSVAASAPAVEHSKEP